MKSSNTRVMVAAYRLLAEAMDAEGMHYPIHLGVYRSRKRPRRAREERRGHRCAAGRRHRAIRSAYRSPKPLKNEIPVAQMLVAHFASRPGKFEVLHPERYSPTACRRRSHVTVPLTHDEPHDGFLVLEIRFGNPTAELRAAILNLDTPRLPGDCETPLRGSDAGGRGRKGGRRPWVRCCWTGWPTGFGSTLRATPRRRSATWN